MKKILFSVASLAVAGLCFAQDFGGTVGRVISATPVIQQVGVPRQVCTTEQVEVQQQKSGAGAAMGAIAGGALGNASGGHGGARAAATMIGVIGGAIVGDRIEGAPPSQVQNIQRCSMQTFYENRPVAYNVVYEYAGKQYSVQMPQDPGPRIQLQVSAVGASTQMAPGYNDMPPQQPVYVQPPSVIVAQPAYPVYYTRPYYPPVSIELGYGYWGGYRGRSREHWR